MKEYSKQSMRRVMKTHYIITLIFNGFLACLLVGIGAAIPCISINAVTPPPQFSVLVYVIAVMIVLLCVFPSAIKLITKPWNAVIDEIMEKYNITDRDIFIEYKQAERVGTLRMHSRVSFVKGLTKLEIIPNYKIIWIYENVTTKIIRRVSGNRTIRDETSRKKQYFIHLHTIDKKRYVISVYQESAAQKIIRSYADQRHILLGYDEYYMELYKHDMDMLLSLQYNAYATGPSIQT